MVTKFEQTTLAPTVIQLGGSVQEYLWIYEGIKWSIAFEKLGSGAPVLLLPSFSTASTRAEMRGLAKLLASQFQVVTLDWPGFGQSLRLPLDYKPELYHLFLQDFVRDVFEHPVAVVTAGHAAGYVMRLAQQQPAVWSRAILVAPTWKGPLPTAFGEHRQHYQMLNKLLHLPIFGQALYQSNTTHLFIRLMYRRHVYGVAEAVTSSLIEQKWQTARQPMARFAAAAFVTGGLDPVQNRADFLAWFQPLPLAVMVVMGEQTPPSSRVEMEQIATKPGVQKRVLATGSLGIHEENPTAVAEAILLFLRAQFES